MASKSNSILEGIGVVSTLVIGKARLKTWDEGVKVHDTLISGKNKENGSLELLILKFNHRRMKRTLL